MSFRSKVGSIPGKIYLHLRGVQAGAGIIVAGLPIVTSVTRGAIVLGDRVELVSISRRTDLGVRGPTIMRTLTPEATITVGADTGMSGAVICAASRVEIGERCLIGADVMIFDTDFHSSEPFGRRYGRPDWSQISKSVVIGNDVFIGTRALITKGITIGDGAVVGAGAVVVRDVEPRTVVAGVPAKFIRQI